MTKQRGNILFLILLAVVLFAALAYAVTSSLRGGGKDAGSENATAMASHITNYASLLEQTVNRLILVNGCSDTSISFQNTVVPGYDASSVPAKCRLFDPAGGGLSWQTPEAKWLIPQAEANAMLATGIFYGEYYFPNTQCILELGTGNCDSSAPTKELIVAVRYLTKNVCEAIDKQLGLSGIPDGGVGCYIGGADKFRGSYFDTGQYQCTPTRGFRSLCINTQGRHGYVYYHVLLAR